MPLIRSWIKSANNAECPFPLNNLALGVFSTSNKNNRCGVAIGNQILDLKELEKAKLINFGGVFNAPVWNDFMALGQHEWARLRSELTTLLAEENPNQDQLSPFLVSQNQAQMHLPIQVTEFTDFYASKHHATNVGTMFRGADNALPANWLHMPIGYNGRASSVVVSGTDIRRPWGQIKSPEDDFPKWAPSQKFDFELELGAIVGCPSNKPLSVDEADTHIFGYVLLNDWSARDIQAWEYQPLGPFQSKATATTISPWIIMAQALAPFRCSTPKRDLPLLPHLQDTSPMLFDIELTVTLTPENGTAEIISQTNYSEMYYSAAQQIAHHTTSGCPMRVGDLIGSGTISGSEKHNRGSFLELSWGGKEPLELSQNIMRSFMEDGDIITLTGAAQGHGYKIGFGECAGTLLPALERVLKSGHWFSEIKRAKTDK